MDINLGVKNIVLLGTFDTSFFDKYFFIKHKIAKEEDIKNVSLFNANGVTQLITKDFSVVITPNQIIVSEYDAIKDAVDINEVAESIIKHSDVSTVTALGINFHYLLSDKKISREDATKQYFYNDKIEIFQEFKDSKDALYGAYVSVDYEDSRLKLDIKPMKATFNNKTPVLTEDVIGFQFNFHFDIKDNHQEKLLKHLKKYKLYKKKSEEMIVVYK